ncbi:MAG: FAD-binding oxidoreductase [Kineosporiaceae bacterium]
MTEPLPALPTPLGGLPALPTLGPVTRRPPPGVARREWVTATVAALRDETEHARTLTLALPDGTPPHTAGQHYVVRAARGDGSWAQRSYSVASAPAVAGGRAAVDLTVERLDGGELSPWLHDLTVGDPVDVRGPFGGWFVWRGESPVLLVGGGSGVVPLASMLRAWRSRGRTGGLHLVVSVRSPGDLFYADELLGAPDTTVVWTRRAPVGHTRPPGRLDAGSLRPFVADAAAAGLTVYVCGSAGFADHATTLLVDLGVPAGAVRVERFGPS